MDLGDSDGFILFLMGWFQEIQKLKSTGFLPKCLHHERWAPKISRRSQTCLMNVVQFRGIWVYVIRDIRVQHKTHTYIVQEKEFCTPQGGLIAELSFRLVKYSSMLSY